MQVYWVVGRAPCVLLVCWCAGVLLLRLPAAAAGCDWLLVLVMGWLACSSSTAAVQQQYMDFIQYARQHL